MIKNHHNKKISTKKINYLFLIIMTILITIPSIKAETTPLPPFPTTTTTTIDTTNIIIQENIKTRLEIKQYCDQKIATMIETVKTEGADIIGSNFAEFDRRIHETTNKIFIKAIVGTFVTILLSLLTYYIIKRKVEKKHPPKATHFKEYPITPTQAGIIPPKPPTEILTSQQTSTNNPPLTPPIPQNNPTPLPTFPELQQPTLLSPLEKERIRREQEMVNERRKKEAEKQLSKMINIHNKNRKKHQKLMKKLNKPEEEARRMQLEHEELEKEINNISQSYNISIPRTNINN